MSPLRAGCPRSADSKRLAILDKLLGLAIVYKALIPPISSKVSNALGSDDV